MPMLILPKQLQEQVQGHGAASYPLEGCGLLVGLAENGRNTVHAIHPLPNMWPNEVEKRVRFLIDPADWQRVELEAAEADLDVIGIFHSHPDHPPIASPRDLAWASWPGYSYLITQIAAGVPTTSQSWQLAADRSRFVEEEVVVSEYQ